MIKIGDVFVLDRLNGTRTIGFSRKFDSGYIVEWEHGGASATFDESGKFVSVGGNILTNEYVEYLGSLNEKQLLVYRLKNGI